MQEFMLGQRNEDQGLNEHNSGGVIELWATLGNTF